MIFSRKSYPFKKDLNKDEIKKYNALLRNPDLFKTEVSQLEPKYLKVYMAFILNNAWRQSFNIKKKVKILFSTSFFPEEFKMYCMKNYMSMAEPSFLKDYNNIITLLENDQSFSTHLVMWHAYKIKDLNLIKGLVMLRTPTITNIYNKFKTHKLNSKHFFINDKEMKDLWINLLRTHKDIEHVIYKCPEEYLTKELIQDIIIKNPNHIKNLLRRQNNSNILDFITDELYIFAVKTSGSILEFIPRSAKTKEICTAAITKAPSAIKFVPKELRTSAMVLKAGFKLKSALKYKVKKQEIIGTGE